MRRNLNSKIDSDKISLLNLMNDTPGGFSRIRLYTDNTAKTVFVNNRFCELRGMTQEEVMRQESVDALSGVHPDDIKKVKNEVREMVQEIINTAIADLKTSAIRVAPTDSDISSKSMENMGMKPPESSEVLPDDIFDFMKTLV